MENYKILIEKLFEEYKKVYSLNEEKLKSKNKLSNVGSYYSTNDLKIIKDREDLTNYLRFQAFILISKLSEDKKLNKKFYQLFNLDEDNYDEKEEILGKLDTGIDFYSTPLCQDILEIQDILFDKFEDEKSQDLIDEIFDEKLIIKILEQELEYISESNTFINSVNYIERKREINLLKYYYACFKLKNYKKIENYDLSTNLHELTKILKVYFNTKQDFENIEISLKNFPILKNLFNLFYGNTGTKSLKLIPFTGEKTYICKNYILENNELDSDIELLFEDLDTFCKKHFKMNLDNSFKKYYNIITLEEKCLA